MSAELVESSVFIPAVVEPLPDDAPEWANVLNMNIGALASSVNQILTAMQNIDNSIGSVKEQVGPIVDGLAANPMFRMLTGGK